jgi:hypothetical protein
LRSSTGFAKTIALDHLIVRLGVPSVAACGERAAGETRLDGDLAQRMFRPHPDVLLVHVTGLPSTDTDA